jgi:hypothetical protein
MKKRMILFTCILALLTNGLVAFAQDQEKAKAKAQADEKAVVQTKMAIAGAQAGASFHMAGGDTFTFVAAEGAFGGKVVKGAPYSAEAVSENIQVLQDGNRIVRKNTSMIYRDGEGRTRTEQTLRSIGPYASAGDPPQTFMIFDPVASVHYTLEPNSKVARKMEMPRIEKIGDGDTVFYAAGVAGSDNIKMRRPGPPPAIIATEGKNLAITRVETEGGRVEFRTGKPENLKSESLGTQMVEGVSAEGTRETFTIPAGEIGNEQPINIVTESWYSPELQVTVMRKHTDPRQGEMVYRLTNIKRAEPDHSLFEVPADYTVKEMIPSRMKMDMENELMRERMKKKEKNDQ